MNKRIIAGTAVLILLLAGGYLFTRSKSTASLTGTQTGSESGGAKSLKDLLSAGAAQKCTFSTADDSGASESTTYVSRGKVRADFTSTDASGKKTVSHMITDGKVNYIWTDGEKTGFKTEIVNEESALPESSPAGNASGAVGDLDEKVDYKCSSWIADDSLFNPPAAVKFTDLSQIINPSSAPDSVSSKCSVCESLSGEEKSECFTALSCK